MTIAAITENHPEKDLATLFPGAEIRWMTNIPAQAQPGIAAYVDLDFKAEPTRIEKLSGLLPAALIFVNAVTPTLQEIGRPFVRINAWPGFATRKVHELVIPGNAARTAPDTAPGSPAAEIAPATAAATATATPAPDSATTPGSATTPAPQPNVTPATTTAHRVKTLYQQLDCRYLTAPDLPGMISARVVAGIINEAWYTWEEKVSTKEEIDTAMRLGTNYPLGPFEWGEHIGLEEVAGLLLALSKTDARYTPANSLLKAAGRANEAASGANETAAGATRASG